jgi:hypothetical protein
MTTLNIDIALPVLQQRVLRLEAARFVFEHHGNAFPDRVGQSICTTDKDLLSLRILQRPLTDRTREDIEQL